MSDQINKYGLNITRFNVAMKNTQRSLRDYKPAELARQFVKWAYELDSNATTIAVQSLECDKVKQNCG